MSNRIWVQVAGEDRRVPSEARGGYFEHDKAYNVRNTEFIQHRIREGDLIEAPAPADAPADDSTGEA